jgi:dTDP-4-amino-4,6-dideoxygalactose transaminase
LPKPFSTQLGGIIKYKEKLSYKCPQPIARYIKSALEPQIEKVESMIQARFDNYHYYLESLRDLNVAPFLKLKKGDVPGVFMFHWPHCKDYRKLKTMMNENGVDSSVFYGNEAYFVPIHHNLTKNEIDYICSIIRYFDRGNQDD